MNAERQHIDVRVGIDRPKDVQQRRPRVALIVACPPDAPSLAAAYPACRVREAGPPAGSRFEHLRIPRGADTSRLPGLDTSSPTRLRDSVRLAFATGVETIDVIAARMPGIAPWEVGHPELVELLEPHLDDLRGLPVAFPDAGGPPVLGSGGASAPERLSAAVLCAHAWSPILAERYAVGLVDVGLDAPPVLFDALGDVAGTEVALCAWEGRRGLLLRHGWRSAAALVAALVATARLPSDPLVGRDVALADGRAADDERRIELGGGDPHTSAPDFAEAAVLRVELTGPGGRAATRARVASEPAMRDPVGSWTVPMLRTAKLVHHRLVVAAEQFVFRQATPEQALTLQNALRLALLDFERHGIVGGAGEAPEARVAAMAIPGPSEPALVATVTAFLRPWLRRIHVDLTVRPGVRPRLEVT